MFQVESQVSSPRKALRRKRCRDKTVLAAAADQSRGSTIKVGVAVSGKQSSPVCGGHVSRRPVAAHGILARRFLRMPSGIGKSAWQTEINVSTRNSYPPRSRCISNWSINNIRDWNLIEFKSKISSNNSVPLFLCTRDDERWRENVTKKDFFVSSFPQLREKFLKGCFVPLNTWKDRKEFSIRVVVSMRTRVLGRRKFEEKVFDSTIGSFLRY